MSTKIYCAWRIPERRLNDFFDLTRPQVFAWSAKIVRSLMGQIPASDPALRDYIKRGYSDKNARFMIAKDKLTESARKPERSPCVDISFGFNVWMKGRFAYIIPVGFREKLKLPRWVQDYSYFDSTDKPEELTKSQWTMRQHAWESINCGQKLSSHNARRMFHSVIDFGYRFGDYEAEMELRNRV